MTRFTWLHLPSFLVRTLKRSGSLGMRLRSGHSWVSPERKNDNLQSSYFGHTQLFVWTFLVLTDKKFTGDYDCELELSKVYLLWDIWCFVMYYIYVMSGPSLLIECTNSMMMYGLVPRPLPTREKGLVSTVRTCVKLLVYFTIKYSGY